MGIQKDRQASGQEELGVVIFITLCTLLLLGHVSFRNNSCTMARNAVWGLIPKKQEQGYRIGAALWDTDLEACQN